MPTGKAYAGCRRPGPDAMINHMGRRGVLALVLVGVVTTGCTARIDGRPTAAAAAVTITQLFVDPCAALYPDQVRAIGLDGPGTTVTDTGLPRCRWTARTVEVTLLAYPNSPLSTVRQGPAPYVDTTLSGRPALAWRPPGGCWAAAGAGEGVVLVITDDPGTQDGSSCPEAVRTVEHAVDNITGRPTPAETQDLDVLANTPCSAGTRIPLAAIVGPGSEPAPKPLDTGDLSCRWVGDDGGLTFVAVSGANADPPPGSVPTRVGDRPAFEVRLPMTCSVDVVVGGRALLVTVVALVPAAGDRARPGGGRVQCDSYRFGVTVTGSARPADNGPGPARPVSLDRLRSDPCGGLEPDQTSSLELPAAGTATTERVGVVCQWSDATHFGSLMADTSTGMDLVRSAGVPFVETTVAGRPAVTIQSDGACLAIAEVEGGAVTSTFGGRSGTWATVTCPAALRLVQEAVRNLTGRPAPTRLRPDLDALVDAPCAVGDEVPFRAVDAVAVTGVVKTFDLVRHACYWYAPHGGVSFLVTPGSRDIADLAADPGNRPITVAGRAGVLIEKPTSCSVLLDGGRRRTIQSTVLPLPSAVRSPCESARRAVEAAVEP